MIPGERYLCIEKDYRVDAFNLLRPDACRLSAGHETIRLRPGNKVPFRLVQCRILSYTLQSIYLSTSSGRRERT
jgi:hypothetical protein